MFRWSYLTILCNNIFKGISISIIINQSVILELCSSFTFSNVQPVSLFLSSGNVKMKVIGKMSNSNPIINHTTELVDRIRFLNLKTIYS